MTSSPAGGQARAPVLVARLGRQQHVFPVGVQIRVGRDPALELVSVNPLVSRDTHGLITSDEKGAVYIDRSRRGTFLDGKRLNGPLRVTESVILRLGDPATGEELGITPPLSGVELEVNRERRERRSRIRLTAIAVGEVAVAGGVAAGTFAAIGSPAPSGKQAVSTSPPVSALSALARAGRDGPAAAGIAVLVLGMGLGTLIAPDGIIQRTGAEQATAAGVGASQRAACGGGITMPGGTTAVFGTDFGGVPAGFGLAMLVELPDGSAVTVPTGGLPQLTATSGSGCLAIQVSAAQLGLAELPSGTYHIQLYGGPTLARSEQLPRSRSAAAVPPGPREAGGPATMNHMQEAWRLCNERGRVRRARRGSRCAEHRCGGLWQAGAGRSAHPRQPGD